MKISPEKLAAEAEATGFRPDVLEKVAHLSGCSTPCGVTHSSKGTWPWVSLISECRIDFSMLEGKVINFFWQFQDG
jgi:hypothetical protein